MSAFKINMIILQIYPILYLLFIFWGAKITKGKEAAAEYLSVEQTKLIQAVACIGVIIHHLVQDVTGYGAAPKGPITVFNYMGILFTSIFFFCSGYGLITSYYTKQDYMRTFLKKRLPTVLIPFWVINLLGVLLNVFIYDSHKNFSQALSDVFGLTLFNSNGWFIVEIVILYLLFYALFSLIPHKDIALALLSIATVILIIYSSLMGHDTGNKAHWFKGEWWYNSTITFVFGMLYARCKKGIEKFFVRFYKVLLPLFCILFLISFNISVYTVNVFGYYHDNLAHNARQDEIITLVSQMIVCLIFMTLVLLLNMKISLGNKALGFISGISVELFLIHGYFIHKIFSNIRVKDYIFFALVLACSILCTALLAPPIHMLTKKIIALLNPVRFDHNTIESKLAEERRNKIIRIVRLVSAAIIVIIFLTSMVLTFGRFLFAKSECKSEFESVKNAQPGDRVYWGYYETNYLHVGKERISWIVVEKDDDTVCLVSEYGIDGSSYNQRHEDISWEDCELREYLNSEEFIRSFSKYELLHMDDSNNDIVSLLTEEEALEFFASDKERELSITSVAEARGTNINNMSKANMWDMKGYRSSWWWLKGADGYEDVKAPIVTVDGTIGEKEVNRPGGAIRPVIRIRLE